ncbi:MAG: RHS repeat-associated core domain-containing protein [Chloroflexota bacterium]|nr:RHS repeat-associated core domain-containing protein [Chloroflexota bacterium]
MVEFFHLLVVVSLLLGLFPVTGHTAPVRDPVATATITPQGGTLVTADGRVTFYFPPDAVSETVEVTAATSSQLAAALPLDAQYKEYGLDVQMHTQAKGDPVSETLRPVTATLNYAGLPGVGNATSQRLLKLYHYDEGAQVWERLPAQVSPATGVLTATAASFSVLALVADTQTGLGDYAEPWAPTVQDFQVDLFTGAATWRIPIDAPTGRGGLSPNLALSYNSGIIAEMYGKLNPQVSWVGSGWNLGAGYIARAIVRDENQVPTAVPTYTLVLNGVSSDLVPVGGNQYRTKDERFWRIERITTGAQNRGDDYWLVTTRDGTQYRFGYADETADDDSILSAWWMLVQHPTSGVETLITVNWRWNLDQIEDTHGNQVRLEYEAEHNDFVYYGDGQWHYYSGSDPCAPGDPTCNWAIDSGYVVGGHLKEIVYSQHADGSPSPAYEIEFVSDSRHDYPDVFDSDQHGVQLVQTFWSKHCLQAIKIEHASGDLIRKYELEHDYLSYAGDSHYMLILNGVWRFDAEGIHSLATTFDYNSMLYTFWDDVHQRAGGKGMKPRLETVHNSYGGSISFNYVEPTEMPSGYDFSQNGRIKAPDPYGPCYWYRYRVRETIAYSGVGPAVRAVYEYRDETGNGGHGGDWDEKVFHGHPRVREIRFYESGAIAAYSDHYFHQGDGNATGNCGGNLQDPDGMEGREYRTIHYDDGGVRLAETLIRHSRTTWGSGDDQRHFVAVDAVCEYAEEGSTVSRRTEYDYDTDHGNVTQVREYESAAASIPYRTTTTSYVIDTGAWIVDRASLVETYAGSAGGQKVAETRYFYDRNGLDLRPWGSAPTAGDLVRVEQRADLAADEWAVVDYWYDQWGNLTEERSYGGYGPSSASTYADPRATTTTYDTVYRQFPVETCNALVQCTQVAYYGANDSNGLFGQVEQVTDPKGATTAFRYDRFGRLKVVKAHDDAGWEPGQVSARYEYRDLGQVGQQRVVAWSGRDATWQESYFDGLGRTVQTHASADAGQEIRTATGYDALGRAVREWLPYEAARQVGYVAPDAGLPHTLTTHDALGRVTRLEHADGTSAQTFYGGRTTTAVDENGHQKRYTDDAFGRVVSVEEFGGVYPSATLSATTEYAYDARDNLTDVWADGHSNHIQVWYDALGRKERMTDPDMGEWAYDYDALGNLEWQEDATGQRIEFEYDALNRLLTKSASEQLLAEYGYDEGQWGVGHRTAMTDTWGVSRWRYDARGRTVRAERTVLVSGTFTGTVWQREWGYDSADRVIEMVYPDGERVTVSYDATGRPSGLRSAFGTAETPWVTGVDYHPAGMIEGLSLGNGVEETWAYDPQRLWPDTHQVQHGAETLLAHTYTHDPVGNLETWQRDEGTWAMTYDSLDRLTSTGTESYGYDPTGNLIRKQDTDYAYDNPLHVHAVTQAGADRYEYDANGNMTLREEGSDTYEQTFDVENRLVAVTVTTGITPTVVRYGYDGDGNLSWREAGGAVELRIGDDVIIRGLVEPSSPPPPSPYTIYLPLVARNAGGEPGFRAVAFEGERYYRLGGAVVGWRVGSGMGNDVYWLHGDQLGSVARVTDEDGEQVLARGYDAWGEATWATGSLTLPLGYTGQQYDVDTGLLYLHARWYYPRLARFISPDTMVPEPGNPQDLNRYSYVRNSPLNYVDPSGYCGGNILTGETSCSGFSTLTVDANLSGAPVVNWYTPPQQPAPQYYWVDTSPPQGDPVGNAILWTLEAVSIGGAVAASASGGQAGGYVGNMPPLQAGLGAGPSGTGTGSFIVPQYTAGSSGVSPRDLPGTVTGGNSLRRVAGQWLRGTDGNVGRIPGQIAARLRGQSFANFDEFRSAFWMAVANDPILASQFSLANQSLMAYGQAPYAVPTQQTGVGRAQQKYNLHHLQSVVEGGGVYDLDNIVIVTPRYHDQFTFGQ